MKNKLYFAIILSVALGAIFQFAGPHISEWMASSAPQPAQQKKLLWFYQQSIFGPLALPAQPMPAIFGRFIPSGFYTFIGTLVAALFFTQIAS